jgi:ATP-binding cassette, subfamily B, bacterial
MAVTMPTRSSKPVEDADGSIVASWERRVRWRSVPGSLYRALVFTARSSPRTVIVSLGLSTIQAAAYATLYVILSSVVPLLSGLTSAGQLLSNPVSGLLAAGGALLVLLAAAASIGDYVQWKLQQEVFIHTDMATLKAAVDVPLEQYEDPRFYELMQRCTNSVGQISAAAPRIVQVVGDIAAILAITLTLATQSAWILPIAAAAALPALITQLLSARRWYRVEAENAWPARLRYYLSNASQRKSAAAEIRSLQLGGTFEAWSVSAWDEMYRAMQKARKKRAQLQLVASTLGGLIMVGGAGLAAASATSGSALAAMVTIVLGLAQLKAMFGQMFGRMSAVADVSLYLGDVETLEGLARQINTRTRLALSRSAPSRTLSSIELKNASYCYPGSSRRAVSDITLTLRSGELIAVVGHNGSGKTTLAKMIAGMLPATAGTITWNGHDYADVQETVRDGVTIQYQEPTRWCFTVRENVWLGDTTQAAGSARIGESLRDAGAESLVRSLDDGMDTRLGKELGPGSDLSGGQWQRLAVARCFFRDSQVVILDEPTSSFDANAEAEFLTSMRRLLKGRAGLLITHRFSSLRRVDAIYVLDDGKLVEQGTHDELVNLNGIYAELYRQQIKNLLEDDDATSARCG